MNPGRRKSATDGGTSCEMSAPSVMRGVLFQAHVLKKDQIKLGFPPWRRDSARPLSQPIRPVNSFKAAAGVRVVQAPRPQPAGYAICS